jgi:polysaccharide biosynthesis transport protein
MPPTYRASTTILTGEDNTNPQVKTEDWVLSQRLASGYAGLAKRQIILESAVKALGLQADWHTVQDNVLVAPVPNTSLLEIRVTDGDPQRAAAIANEITRQLIIQSPTMTNQLDLQQRQSFTQAQLDALQSNIQAAQAAIDQKRAALDTETSTRSVADLNDQIKALDTKVTGWRTEYERLLGEMPVKSPNTITVVETAVPPAQPVSPNILFNVMLAGLAGLVLSCGSVFLMEYLRAGTIRNLAELGRRAGGPGLAAITREHRKQLVRGASLIITDEPHSRIAEQFRVLRSNLRFAWAGPEPIVFVITSATVGEGKSTISGNLAVSFAQAGKQTILVDADLRHPTLHTMFGVGRAQGLTSLLSPPDEAQLPAARKQSHSLSQRLAEAMVETYVPNLALVPAGPVVPTNPGELLASPEMAQLLDLMRRSVDVVIIDAPPLLPVADTAILASLPLGVVLVAESDRTSANSVSFARGVLDQAQARLLGVILNKAAATRGPYYSYPEEQESAPKSRRLSLGLLRGR